MTTEALVALLGLAISFGAILAFDQLSAQQPPGDASALPLYRPD